MKDSVLSLVFVLLLLTPTLLGALYPFEKKQRVAARASAARDQARGTRPLRAISVATQSRH